MQRQGQRQSFVCVCREGVLGQILLQTQMQRQGQRQSFVCVCREGVLGQILIQRQMQRQGQRQSFVCVCREGVLGQRAEGQAACRGLLTDCPPPRPSLGDEDDGDGDCDDI